MKRVALVSSGFLRNYPKFLGSELYMRLCSEFECHVYISTWNEDGYGSNATHEYSGDLISESDIRVRFGDRLKFLKRESFAEKRPIFKYSPVRNLLCHEPQVLEKYRSKFYSLSMVEVPPGYEAYLHVRFDMVPHEEVSNNILSCLRSFDPSGDVVYASEDIFGRQGCMGDTFHVLGHSALTAMQGFYRRLFDTEYLDLDIPCVPERVLWHYFTNEVSDKRIEHIPGGILLDRSRFG